MDSWNWKGEQPTLLTEEGRHSDWTSCHESDLSGENTSMTTQVRCQVSGVCGDGIDGGLLGFTLHPSCTAAGQSGGPHTRLLHSQRLSAAEGETTFRQTAANSTSRWSWSETDTDLRCVGLWQLHTLNCKTYPGCTMSSRVARML